MNSASSSTETKKARFLPFFGLTLKQNWTSGFLIAIIYFFTLVVPTMFTVSNAVNHYLPEERQTVLLEQSQELMAGLRYFTVPITAILAVVMTCVMLRYLKDKVAVDFYHSLPIGRRRLYLTRMLAGYLMVLVPLILMTAVSTAILAANGAMNQTVFDMVVKLFSDSVLYSLVYYGLGAVVGMISGVTGVHLVLTGVAVFLPPGDIFPRRLLSRCLEREYVVRMVPERSDALSPLTGDQILHRGQDRHRVRRRAPCRRRGSHCRRVLHL